MKIKKVILFSLMLVVVLFGCKKKNVNKKITNSDDSSFFSNDYSGSSFSSEDDFYLPEEEPVIDYDDNGVAFYPLSNFGHTYGSTKNADNSDAQERVLTDDEAIKSLDTYEIKYSTKKIDLEKKLAELHSVLEPDSVPAGNVSEKKVKELKVVSWGPEKEIPGLMTQAVFYVIFSEPVHMISAVDLPAEKSDVISIFPKVKGVFRWAGTRQINFYPSERLDPFTKYKIEVNSSLKSLEGAKITGNTTFNTSMDYIRIVDIRPGSTPEQSYYYNSSSGLPLEKTTDCFVQVNLNLTADEFKKNVEVVHNTYDKVGYTATPIRYEKDNGTYKYKTVKESNLFYLKMEKQAPKEAEVKFIANPTVSELKNSKSYTSLKRLTLYRMYFDVDVMRLSIEFNQPIQKETVASGISFSPSIKISPDNIKVNGRYVYIDNVAAQYRTSYSCYASTSIKDIYGQSLSRVQDTSFTVPEAGAFLKFLDDGNKILEAQFPHKFIIEHQNLEEGRYSVAQINDPLENNNPHLDDGSRSLNLNHPDMRVRDVIDLDPYLRKGLGFIRIAAEGKYKYYSPWDERYYTSKPSRAVTIQVTDLGVSARMGFNKVVAMVRKLSDNSPVAGADVYLCRNDGWYDDWSETSSNYGHGKTDSNGFVEINISNEDLNSLLDEPYDIALFVKKGDDKLVYNIYNHSASRFDVTTRNPRYAYEDSKMLNFIFTDRGIYKPGETISYRGIVRSLDTDGLKNAYAGKRYYATFEKHSWYESETYGTSDGYFSREGGYYGTFDVPEDIKPGTYSISISCGDEECDRAYVTIAYFERLKFQATAEIPDVNYTLGESINAELSASYLAGGALTGGSYRATWYKQETDFIPPVPEANNYVFGPTRSSYSPQEIAEVSGAINENGPTKIKCDTEKTYNGQAYLYRTEISVTDISNQTIFTGAAKIIHPGTFYIGVAKRLGKGFPSAKTKVDIPFALFKPNGAYAGTGNVDGDIKYEISRQYWTTSSEDSVDGVYLRWVKKDEDVTSGSIKAQTKGVISFTPQNAGEYTIRVLANDKKGNLIKTEKRFYVTGNDYWWFDSTNASALNLSPDRSSYKPGETAQILLESPLAAGDYMITVERNNIYTAEIKHFDTPCSVIEIPVKEEYLPIVYVSICSYSTRSGPPTHQYGEPDLDKPKGYYGVTAIKVDLDTVSFKAELYATKKVCRPGDEVELEVKAEKDGKPLANAEFTLMVVDRGVLDLINYHVADPMQFFYNPYNYPLTVIGGDSRSYLMDPVTYQVKTLVGGDEDGGDELKEQERKDFRPTALFEPVIKTDSKGRAIVKFKMPDSLTTYRVTAFGVQGNSFALKEAEIQVQNPINIQAVQPRRMRIRDTAECGVIATNLDTVDHDVTVTIETLAPSKNLPEDEEKGYKTVAGKVFVQGEKTITVKVPAGRTKPIYFKVGADKVGAVELVYHVKSDVLKEKLVSPILVEKPYVYETFATTGVVESASYTKAEKVTGKEKVLIPAWTDDDRGELTITLDPTQLGLLGSSVKYVFDYPYGCLEQQSSRIWPLLAFTDYIDVFGLKSKVEDPRKTIKLWFASVKDNQLSCGGIPYWPNGIYPSAFVSLRFAHMYKLAIDRGFSKNEIGYDIDKLLSYLKSEVNYKRYKNFNNCYSAYACYVFTLLGNNGLDNVLNDIYDIGVTRRQNMSLETLAYAGLAYQNKNDPTSKKRAEEIMAIIRSCITPTARSVNFDKKYVSYSYYYDMYDNDAEMLASIMQLFARHNPNDEIVGKILFRLLQSQKDGYWQSTATTARVFESIYELIKLRKLDSLDFKASAVVKYGSTSNTVAEGKFKGAGAKPTVSSVDFKDSVIASVPKGKAFDIEYTKDGKGSLYYTTEMRYAIPSELYGARNEGLEVVMQIVDENGNVVTPPSADSKVIVLESGKTYKIRTSVNSSACVHYIALRVPIPSGSEIVDTSLSTGASKNTSGDTVQNSKTSIWSDWWYDFWDDWYWDWTPETYEYFYDNEAQYFSNYYPGGNWSKTVTIRAARKGVYPTPPVTAELMYEPEVFGRTDGYLYIIK